MTKAEESTGLALNSRLRVAPQVYDHLRTAIINLELPPGELLSRSELMLRFGVSQTPIRDALMSLADEGLVAIYPQNGTSVTLIDTDLALQAHFLRRSVELEVVDLLARTADEPLFTALQAILARQELCLACNDLDAFDEGDSTLHRTLYKAAGIPSLWTTIRRMSGHIDRLRRLNLPDDGKAQSVLSEHREIVTALQGGRPELAREAMRVHLSGTLTRLEEIKRRFPHYMR